MKQTRPSRDQIIAAARKVIRVGQQYKCIIPDLPQVMTVVAVTETEVHFSRKGKSGISIMDICKFCEVAINPLTRSGNQAAGETK